MADKKLNTTNQHPTLTGSEILWATLAGEGVTTVFGCPFSTANSTSTSRRTKGIFDTHANTISNSNKGTVTTA